MLIVDSYKDSGYGPLAFKSITVFVNKGNAELAILDVLQNAQKIESGEIIVKFERKS